jgi:hypothetical protein
MTRISGLPNKSLTARPATLRSNSSDAQYARNSVNTSSLVTTVPGASFALNSITARCALSRLLVSAIQ